jgi:hypothetical protein
MIIKNSTIKNATVQDGSFPVAGTSTMLLYLDAGNTASYSGSGTTWSDLSGNGANGTLQNSPTYSSSNGGYFTLNGSTQYSSSASSKFNKTYTGKTVFFAGTIASMSSNSYRNMIGTDNGGGSRNFSMYAYYSGSAYQLHWSTGPTNNWSGTLSANLPYTLGNWFTCAVTHTTAGVQTYYFNGQQLGSPTSGVTFYQYQTATSENVGAADNYWNGNVSVVGVWGSVLTLQQIKSCHNAVGPRYGLATV